MKQHFLASVAAAAFAAFVGSAHAQASTDSLAGWNTLGDVVSQSGAITLTTAYLDDMYPEPGNVSGHAAVDAEEVARVGGVALTALDLADPDVAYEGSIATQGFAVAAGQTLSFDWSFATHETLFLDHAFAIVDGQVFTLATTARPGGASQAFTYRFAQAGQASFAIGVVDTGDFNGVSQLTVGNLALGSVAAVPEPATNALLLGGLWVVGLVAARRRNAR